MLEEEFPWEEFVGRSVIEVMKRVLSLSLASVLEGVFARDEVMGRGVNKLMTWDFLG